MAVEKILVVDDELMIRKVMEDWLRAKRYSVHSAADLGTAERMLKAESFDLVFLDRKLPDGEGTDLLEWMHKLANKPMVVIMTGLATLESAIAGLRFGAFDYLMKPFSKAEVELLVKRADSFNHVVRVNRLLTAALSDASEVIGQSSVFQRLREVVSKVAPTEATVLIQGENGTGKELVARSIYQESARRDAPFLKLNCAAVPEHLIESELFGHEKGAFAGATERCEGRLELAHGGTLLLDEVSEIPPPLQATLLRVLQEREFERVGGNKTIKVDVRVLATTSRDILKAVERGGFREDLYYRLNVFPIHVPSLRERREDIVLLAHHFLQRFARQHGVAVAGFSDAALAALQAHPWPGNVRELQHTIERAVVLSEPDEPVEASALGLNGMSPVVKPGAARKTGAAPGGVQPLRELEKQAILRALEHTGGNRTKAAELLGISIRTLRNKLKEYAVEVAEPAGV
jgi:DNA-binding NtrC family response regulator